MSVYIVFGHSNTKKLSYQSDLLTPYFHINHLEEFDTVLCENWIKIMYVTEVFSETQEKALLKREMSK